VLAAAIVAQRILYGWDFIHRLDFDNLTDWSSTLLKYGDYHIHTDSREQMEARLARSASDGKSPADVPSSVTSPADEDEEVRVVILRADVNLLRFLLCKGVMSPEEDAMILTNACNANVFDGILHLHS